MYLNNIVHLNYILFVHQFCFFSLYILLHVSLYRLLIYPPWCISIGFFCIFSYMYLCIFFLYILFVYQFRISSYMYLCILPFHAVNMFVYIQKNPILIHKEDIFKMNYTQIHVREYTKETNTDTQRGYI